MEGGPGAWPGEGKRVCGKGRQVGRARSVGVLEREDEKRKPRMGQLTVAFRDAGWVGCGSSAPVPSHPCAVPARVQ